MTTSQHRGKRSVPIARFSRAVAVFATAVATTLVVAGAGAFADPGNTSHVDEVTAAVDASGIAVTGRATFVDVPGVVGEDANDDAVGSAAPLGHELTTATISRPDPFADTVRFTLGVANQPPAINGIPEFLVYQWDFTVTADGGQRDLTLWAWRRDLFFTPVGVDPTFLLSECPAEPDPDTGVGSCRVLSRPAGTMADGVITWDVSMSDISAQPGGVISSDGIAAVFSVSGRFSGGVVYDEVANYHPYTVPGPTVRIGIAPTGTPVQDIPLTVNSTVNTTGAFRGLLPTPATPGEYTVVAQACHGTASCGTTTTTISIT